MEPSIISAADPLSSAASAAIHPVHEWGISVIRAIQEFGGRPLELIAEAFSFVGGPAVYILIIAALYWCVDERKGYAVGLVLFVSNGVNIALKESFRVPRPFSHDPSIKLIDETGWSTPSGHSQNSAAFWPFLVFSPKRKSAGTETAAGTALPDGAKRAGLPPVAGVLAAVGLPLLIGLSRIALGVHYPTDVLAGWLAGAAISAAALFAVPALRRNPAALSLADALARSAARSGKSMRSFRLSFAAAAALLLNAFSAGDASMGGMIFGFAAGRILLTDTGKSGARFSAAEGSFAKKTVRLALGLAGLGCIYVGLKFVFPGEGSRWYSLFRFVRYGLAGTWATWAAPRLFILIGLSRTDR